MENPKIIVMYGAPWSDDCRKIKNYLDARTIPYVYVNMEEHPSAADEVTQLTNGYQKIPTIVFPDGTVLVEPTEEELGKKLKVGV